MENTNNFLNKIQSLQDDYYSKNKKNVLFKEKQKEDCAKTISKQFILKELLENTFFIIPNTNKIYIEYLLFKTFVEPSNYNDVLKRMFDLINFCIVNYKSYEVHINLSTFTISSAQRYKDVISMYNSYCLSSETQYASLMKSMHVYNMPNVMDTIISILNPFIDVSLKTKICLHNKNESPQLLDKLFVVNGL